jgi:hypothetical protein
VYLGLDVLLLAHRELAEFVGRGAVLVRRYVTRPEQCVTHRTVRFSNLNAHAYSLAAANPLSVWVDGIITSSEKNIASAPSYRVAAL